MSTNAVQYGAFRFAETNSEELISYAILTVAIALIIYFAVFVDAETKPTVTTAASAEQTPAISVAIRQETVPAVVVPSAPTVQIVAASPERRKKEENGYDSEAEDKHDQKGTPKKTPKKAAATPKKRSSTPNKKQRATDIGLLTSPDGRRVSARLQTRPSRSFDE